MGGIIQTQSANQFQVRLNDRPSPTDGEFSDWSEHTCRVVHGAHHIRIISRPQDILPDTWGLWIDSRRQRMALLAEKKTSI